MGIDLSPDCAISIDPDTLATTRGGVFAGGDVVSGPNTVIEAIAAGKKAALMIESYRYTTQSIELEVPAGIVETGESIIEAVDREILEETGYNTFDHVLIYSFNPMNGISDAVYHIVKCQAHTQIACSFFISCFLSSPVSCSSNLSLFTAQ